MAWRIGARRIEAVRVGSRLRGSLADTAPLRESPAFRRLWISQLCSSFGAQMTTIAVLFQVWQSTGSAAWTEIGRAHV